MPAPFKHDLTILNAATTSTNGVYVADVQILAIQWPAAFTGATISFTGAGITQKSGTNTEPATYVAIVDSTGAAVTVAKQLSKISVLTEAQRDAIAAAAWVKAVSASAEGADRTITLLGISRYR